MARLVTAQVMGRDTGGPGAAPFLGGGQRAPGVDVDQQRIWATVRSRSEVDRVVPGAFGEGPDGAGQRGERRTAEPVVDGICSIGR